MTPDDPRHGEYRGYRAGCRDRCCRTAAADYERTRQARLYLSRGAPLLVDARGSIRRLQALAALGWPLTTVSAMLGRSPRWATSVVIEDGKITPATAARIAAGYEALSGRRPRPSEVRPEYAERCRRQAAEKGWAAPLAWEDIDRDTRPVGVRTAADNKRTSNQHTSRADHCDLIVVEAILSGDYKNPGGKSHLTRLAVIDRWPSSDGHLERLTGWNVSRDRRRRNARTDQHDAA